MRRRFEFSAAGRFFRCETDGTRRPVMLEGCYAGPQPSACWLLGGGPSLGELDTAAMAASPLPKMAVNLAGTGLLRPTFWTAYDRSSRFLRSVYLDAGILKFVPQRRAMETVPETTFKVCECPATFFFEQDPRRLYSNWLSPERTGIVDWRDSFVQAVEILYRLGFRRLYLAGCEMWVSPSSVQVERALQAGVRYIPGERLRGFLQRCEAAGLSAEELDRLPAGRHYHFPEQKSLPVAARTDEHYYRVVQFLRLSRRMFASAGLELISVTPRSRLNDYFSFRPLSEVLGDIQRTVGHPGKEEVRGLYSHRRDRQPRLFCPPADVMPPSPSSPESSVPLPLPPGEYPLRLGGESEGEPEILAEWEGWQEVTV